MNHWEPKIWRQFDKNGMLQFQKIKRTPDGEWEDYYPQKPLAWYYVGSNIEPPSVALDHELDDDQKANCVPLYEATPNTSPCKRCEAYKSLISALEKELSRYRSGEIR